MRADIALDGTSFGTVLLDLMPVECAVNRLVLTAEVGKPPRLELNFAIVEITDQVNVSAEVRYAMAVKTRAALIALGWTPPAETKED